MAKAAADQDELATSSDEPSVDPKGIFGVAKAVAVGFKAAQAPQAVGNVARLAGVLGFASSPGSESHEVEMAYFDR